MDQVHLSLCEVIWPTRLNAQTIENENAGLQTKLKLIINKNLNNFGDRKCINLGALSTQSRR